MHHYYLKFKLLLKIHYYLILFAETIFVLLMVELRAVNSPWSEAAFFNNSLRALFMGTNSSEVVVKQCISVVIWIGDGAGAYRCGCCSSDLVIL